MEGEAFWAMAFAAEAPEEEPEGGEGEGGGGGDDPRGEIELPVPDHGLGKRIMRMRGWLEVVLEWRGR